MPTGFSSIDALLLARQHVVCVPAGHAGPVLPEAVLQGLEVNLEQLGYALSTQLAQRLRTLALDDINALWAMLLPALQAKLGGGQQHVPLLRHFPYDIPDNTPLHWVWLGEFLHPHEYQQRFPQVAQARCAAAGAHFGGAARRIWPPHRSGLAPGHR